MSSHVKEIPVLQCILQCENSCTEQDNIDKICNYKWEPIQEISFKWKSLDKFGQVYDTVD